MLKTAAAAMTVLLVAASPAAHAQNAPARQGGSSTIDRDATTDVRIHVIKAALQLTPEQEKYWPAVEQAIRARAKARQERVAKIREQVEHLRDAGPREALGNRDPIEFLNRRADALAQRSAGLKKLAEAWEPLYRTLDQDQKQRARFVTMAMLVRAARGIRSSMQDDDEADED